MSLRDDIAKTLLSADPPMHLWAAVDAILALPAMQAREAVIEALQKIEEVSDVVGDSPYSEIYITLLNDIHEIAVAALDALEQP